jgi:ADP-ribose pyrophosphatase
MRMVGSYRYPGDMEPRGLKWQVVDREAVHDYGIFRSHAVRSRHPVTGEQRRFTVLDMPDWVNVIAVTPAREIVLVRQWRHGVAGVEVEIPGGMVDAGESHAEAAARELREETGFVARAWRQLGVSTPNPAIQSNRLWTWLALDVERTAEVAWDPGEVIDVDVVPMAEVEAMLRDGRIGHALVLAAFAHLMVQKVFA